MSGGITAGRGEGTTAGRIPMQETGRGIDTEAATIATGTAPHSITRAPTGIVVETPIMPNGSWKQIEAAASSRWT